MCICEGDIPELISNKIMQVVYMGMCPPFHLFCSFFTACVISFGRHGQGEMLLTILLCGQYNSKIQIHGL